MKSAAMTAWAWVRRKAVHVLLVVRWVPDQRALSA